MKQKGKDMENLEVTANLSQQERNAWYCHIIQNGTEEEVRWANGRLLEENIRLLHDFTNRCIQFTTQTFDYDDAFQEACLGLIRAAKTYNPNKGKFSTYLFDWVRQHINRKRWDTGTGIRIPIHMTEKMYRLRKSYGLSSVYDEKITDMFSGDNTLSSEEKENFISTIRLLSIASLDYNIGSPKSDDSKITLGQMTKNEIDVEEEALKNALKDEVKELMECLTDREKLIIKRRYGIIGDPVTLEYLSKELGLTRERVRQIEKQALQKLRYCVSRKGYESPETGRTLNIPYSATFAPARKKKKRTVKSETVKEEVSA